MKRSHRILLTVLKILGLIPVLLAAVWVYFDISYGRQLDRELAKLRAEGAPLSLAEAAPKAPPPDQNAATLCMPIFQVNFDPEKPEYPKDAKGLRRFQVPDTYRPGDWASVEVMRPVLSSPDCRKALVALREASLRRQCVFPVRWQDGPDTIYPHLAQFRQATRLCSAQAMLEAKAGNVAGALDWLGVCYRMAEHASHEPTLIAQRVEFGMLAITNKAAETILNVGDVTPETAATLHADLDRLQVVPHFGQAMRGERAMGLGCFRMIAEGKWSLVELAGLAGTDSTPPPAHKVLAGVLRPYLKLEEVNYLDYMGQFIKRSEQPYRMTAGTLDADQVRMRRFGSFMSAMLMPASDSTRGRCDQALAELDILRIGLALKLIKRATGSYPATLDALGPTRAKDIFTGRDFIYQRVGQGFKLYSVGLNLRDDHGVGDQLKAFTGRDTDDIVWECPR